MTKCSTCVVLNVGHGNDFVLECKRTTITADIAMSCHVTVLEGDHFFILKHPQAIAQKISGFLQQELV